MVEYTDPDQDKTNPPPEYIHQRFDETTDEGEGAFKVEEYEATREDDLIDRLDLGLYDSKAAVNRPDPALEESREEPFFDTLFRESILYPDEFERRHPEKYEDETYHDQEEVVKNYYGPMLLGWENLEPGDVEPGNPELPEE